jgi:hypothetical protein
MPEGHFSDSLEHVNDFAATAAASCGNQAVL